MNKHQNIIFKNNLDFKILEGGIIKKDTKILNLFFADISSSNRLCLVGNSLEWVTKIWIDHESENLQKLDEINIICLMGDLSKFALHCQQLFSKVKINYYLANLYLQKKSIYRTLINQRSLSNKNQKEILVYSSIGTMRLNRYLLVKESIEQKLNNIYYPHIPLSISHDFENQISKILNTNIQEPKEFYENRLYTEALTQNEFNSKQIKFLEKVYVHIVVTAPNTDWLVNKDDEKYFDSILTKSIPFMLCEKASNINGLKLLGFLPYEGFDLTSDNIKNPILRWHGLIRDNISFFKNKEKIMELYNKNRFVIEENYKRLINTDWEKEAVEQFNNLPNFIKEFLNTHPINEDIKY